MTRPRLAPPFWQRDAYTLPRLAAALRDFVLKLPCPLHAELKAVDFGAADAPYRPLFEAAGNEYLACDTDERAALLIIPGHPLPLAAGAAAPPL